MNLSELLQSNPDLVTLRGLALILTPELNATLQAVQAALPARTCVAQPMALVDGRFMLGADLLTEIAPRFGPNYTMVPGFYQEGFGQLPQEALPLVEVIPMAEALALLPLAIDEDAPQDDPQPPPYEGTIANELAEHDGETWLWDRRRWPDGTFMDDILITPENEAYEWVMV